MELVDPNVWRQLESVISLLSVLILEAGKRVSIENAVEADAGVSALRSAMAMSPVADEEPNNSLGVKCKGNNELLLTW